MHFITGPTWNQTFGIRDADRRVLDHVALDAAIVAVAVRRVAAAREVDGNDAIAPEEVRVQSRRASRLIIRRQGHEVGLEEMDTC